MWLEDLNSPGGTIYAWGGTTSGTLQPFVNELRWNVQVGLTPMPIPLLNTPLLLNFGGANPQITVSWTITPDAHYTGSAGGDWNLLMNTIQWGANASGYTLHITEVGNINVSGFAYSVSLDYVGGSVTKIDASLTFYPGTIV